MKFLLVKPVYYIIYEKYDVYFNYVRKIKNMNKKREKFVELAEKRVEKTLHNLKLIGNLSNKSAYEYDEADINQIFRAIQKELDVAKSRFKTSRSSDGPSFKIGRK